MESKKQFVLVPPMTDPLVKLNEVFDNNNDENAEVSLIDDLKELNQFVAITGQCVVVFSNPKKCAKFLQDNRSIISKSHCKIILISPLDIPAPTLAKFTKAGLTESILESSPPKKITYKISLHLRSLKSNKLSLPDDQIVKSLIDTSNNNSKKIEVVSDHTSKLETQVEKDDLKIQPALKEKKEIKERDIYQNLKGKTNFKEETIDTKWKTQRDTLEIKLEKPELNEKNKEDESHNEKIETYLHGKSEASEPEIIETNENLKGKIATKEEAIAEKIITKKEALTELEIDAAKRVKKKEELINGAEENLLPNKIKAKEIELNLDKEIKRKNHHLEEDQTPTKLKEKSVEIDQPENADEKRKNKKPFSESIIGFMKGKSKSVDQAENTKKKNRQESGIIEEPEKPKKKIGEKVFNIIDELKAKRAKAKADKDEKIEKSHKSKAGYTETLDEKYRSKEDGKTENINTLELGSFFTDKTKKIETYERQERKIFEESIELETKKKNVKVDLGLEGTPSKKKKSLAKEDISEEDKDKSDSNKSKEEVEYETNQPRTGFSVQDESEKKEKKSKKISPQIDLELIQGEKQKDKGNSEQPNKDQKNKDSQPFLERVSDQNIHEGQVDKIDKYLRSPQTKKEEQDWSKIKKAKIASISLAKNKKNNAEEIIENSKVNTEEHTIDYRKIKEAFSAKTIVESSSSEDPEHFKTSPSESTEFPNTSLRMNEIVLDTKGFDFTIRLLNQIYARDYKPSDLYEYLTKELINIFEAYPVVFTYDPNIEKFNTAYNCIERKDEWSEFDSSVVNWWKEYSSDEAKLKEILSKNMTAWICKEISRNRTSENEYWEDSQLPSWAHQELSNKKIELIYPFYDGLELMGSIIVFFPNGIDASLENHYYTLMEMARSAQMDYYYQFHKKLKKDNEEENNSTKKTGFLENIFNRKKSG